MKLTELLASQAKKHGSFLQFIKFCLVGVSNTLISYGIEMLGYYVLLRNSSWQENTKILVISVTAFVISVTNSYYWNNVYVFRSAGTSDILTHLRRYCKVFLSYGVTGLVLGPALKIWLTSFSIPLWFASLAVLVITIPINFLLNKLWAFRK